MSHQHWLDFYDPGSSRRFIALIRYAPELPPRPLPNPELKAQRVEWIWQNYLAHICRKDWLVDDTLPYIDMLTGTELFAEAFGCKVYRPDDSYPIAIPFVNSATEADKLSVPSLDAPPLRLAFEMADELQRRSGPGTLFRLVDAQSPMDVAALIWEKARFYPALIESPEAVMCLASKIQQLQFNFFDEWFKRYGTEFIAHYPAYYMPQGISLSVDEIGAVSRRMFDQFFLPELEAFSERYGGLGMHSCATNRHQWENIKKIPRLRMLNIIRPEAELRQAYPLFAEFVPQWHSGWDPNPDTLEDWVSQLPPHAKVVIDMTASTKEQALDLSERLQRFTS
jgi:hypothetical protein